MTESQQYYDSHPGVAMVGKWRATLAEKSGRTLDEWISLVENHGPADRRPRIAWLRQEQGLGTNSATWIVDYAEGTGVAWDGDPAAYVIKAKEYVDHMFAGPKVGLRPLYDALYTEARALGGDIRISPATTIVSIYRHHVIAQIKPSTKDRIDFGLALGNTPPEGRLDSTGGLARKDRITHRLAVKTARDIDAELRGWLRKAYALDGSAPKKTTGK